jgi:hypothetical protein
MQSRSHAACIGINVMPATSSMRHWVTYARKASPPALLLCRRPIEGAFKTSDLGTPEELGTTLANVAPNSVLLEVSQYKDKKGQVWLPSSVPWLIQQTSWHTMPGLEGISVQAHTTVPSSTPHLIAICKHADFTT